MVRNAGRNTGRSTSHREDRASIASMLQGDRRAQALARSASVRKLAEETVALVDAHGAWVHPDDAACMLAYGATSAAAEFAQSPKTLLAQSGSEFVHAVVELIVATSAYEGMIDSEENRALVPVAIPFAIGLIRDLGMAARLGSAAALRGDHSCTLANMASDSILRITDGMDPDGESPDADDRALVEVGALRLARTALRYAADELMEPGALALDGSPEQVAELAEDVREAFSERIADINELVGDFGDATAATSPFARAFATTMS